MKKNGIIGTKTYCAWVSAKYRCRNPSAQKFKHYGGRGISVCERWNIFENFLADMGECPPGRSLDRINNDGNYEPGNCRWATPAEQRNNSRQNVFLEFDGKRMTLVQWSRHLGIRFGTIQARRARGLPINKILAVNELSSGTKYCVWLEHNGKRMTITQWAKHLKLNHSTISSRLKRGLSISDALSQLDLRNTWATPTRQNRP